MEIHQENKNQSQSKSPKTSSSSSSISLLAPEVSSQIAAGEVVERPSHLVKELLENSLDAQSTEIELHFDEGGRNIRLKDNGVGIPKNELALSLTRHATSKIRTFSDLSSLRSFGFRGEALASVASVSRFTITSRQKGTPQAYQLKSHFGELSSIQEVGGEEGSLVVVEDLFANLPARLKFLKSEISEFQQIRNTVKALAMAHPQVSFRIRSKSKLLYFWPPSNLLSRIEAVLEKKNLFFHEHLSSDMKIQVVLGSPHQSFKQARHLWFFVQNRWVQDKTLQSALLSSYDRLLMKREYPIAALFLNCDSDFVDVNIHPNKSQIKFRDSSLVFKRVFGTLRNALSKTPWLNDIFPEKESSYPPFFFKRKENPQNLEFRREGFPLRKEGSSKIKDHFNKMRDELDNNEKTDQSLKSAKEKESPQNTSFSSYSNFKEIFPNTPEKQKAPQSSENKHAFQKNSEGKKPNGKPHAEEIQHSLGKNIENNKIDKNPISERAISWSRLNIVGQAHLTYIVTESETSLIFLDQHALHERICYEKYRKAIREKKGFEVQNFLLPYDIKMEEDKVEFLETLFSDLKDDFGLHLDRMGPSHIVLRASPSFIQPESLSPVLHLLARDWEETGGSLALERRLGDIVATIACHSSIRAGHHLEKAEIRALLVQMEEFSFSSFCPHGRPVFFEYPFSRLEKEFKRVL